MGARHCDRTFDLIVEIEDLKHSLGLQIGIDYGPVTITRVGIKGRRDRLTAGRAVFAAEDAQGECTGVETKLGETAAAVASVAPAAALPNASHRAVPPWPIQNAGVATIRALNLATKSPYVAGEKLPKDTPLLFDIDKTIAQQVAAQLPWFHLCTLLDKLSSRDDRDWYLQKSVENGWSRAVLVMQIETRAKDRFGRAITNFATSLPSPHSDLASSTKARRSG